MKSFSKILVPVDFLPHSAAAVRHALDLAVQHSAEVILLYAYEPGEYPATPGDVIYDAEQLLHMSTQVRARLDAVRRDADPLGRCRITTRVAQGTAPRAIVEVATEQAVDLIVMGTHGRTGVGRAVWGSVAEQVMRRAPCPVLTIKTARPSALQRFVAGPAPFRWSLGSYLAPRWARRALRADTAPTLETTHSAPRSHLPPRV
jgi:nucleotide-binding universal stress UspA family protein